LKERSHVTLSTHTHQSVCLPVCLRLSLFPPMKCIADMLLNLHSTIPRPTTSLLQDLRTTDGQLRVLPSSLPHTWT
uniref:Ovule protein n=1 Tax=Haemonchus placei TaxID=6290 RepID=A0A158QR12_HAEPC